MDFFIKLNCLELSRTLFCGQCFRFTDDGGGHFHGFAGDRYIELRQERDGVTLLNVREQDIQFWLDYFDAELDYDAILSEFSRDETLRSACRQGGIRVLRQQPFETLISFIISQNNNIKRITGIIERLCSGFGEEIDGGCAFPTAQKLASLSEADLAPLRAGFRSRYIMDAARKVASGEISLEQIAAQDTDSARESLKKIVGVGDKVADCVLLFGFHRLEAVPRDVWIKRVIAEYYPGGLPECVGCYAGIAQQYLFDYARKNAENIGG